MRYDYLKPFFFQKTLDHLFSLTLIMILLLLALKAYRVTHQMVEVCARVASVDDLRLDVQYHYAQTGLWPKDLQSIIRSRPAEVAYNAFSGDELSVADGTITILPTISSIKGEAVSLHPAVWGGNTTGPISWVVGPGKPENGRIVQGPDFTTVDQGLIPADWK